MTVDPFTKIRKRYLWANFVDSLGAGMVTLASSYIIYSETGSVSITGLIVVCTNVPALLLPSAATSLANRRGGPWLYVWACAAFGVISFAPAILSATGHLTTAALLVWYVALGATLGLLGPSVGLVRRIIAPEGEVPEFNSAVTRNNALASVIGLLVGGAVFAAVGPTWIYLFAAITCLLCPLAIHPVIKLAPTMAPETPERFRDFFEVRRSNPGIRAAFRFTGLAFFAGSFTVTLPAIATMIGSNAGILSVLQAASIVGGLFVAYAVRRLHRRVGWGRVQRACYIVTAVGLSVLAWTVLRDRAPLAMFIIALLAIIPVGFALNLDSSVLNSLVQVGAPAENRAAVLTGYSLIPMIVVPLGQQFVGIVSDVSSVGVSIGVVAALMLVAVVLGPHLHLREEFDRLEEADLSEIGDGTVLAADDSIDATYEFGAEFAAEDRRPTGTPLSDDDQP